MIDLITGLISGIVGGAIGAVGQVIWGVIGAIVNVLAAVADRVVALLPDATNLGLTIPSGWLLGYSILDSFLPIHEALALVAVMIAMVLAGLAFRVGVIVYHLIPKPGIGT